MTADQTRNGEYNWAVSTVEYGDFIVTADFIDITDGDLTFSRVFEKSTVVVESFCSGLWFRCSILSALDLQLEGDVTRTNSTQIKVEER